METQANFQSTVCLGRIQHSHLTRFLSAWSQGSEHLIVYRQLGVLVQLPAEMMGEIWEEDDRHVPQFTHAVILNQRALAPGDAVRSLEGCGRISHKY